MTNSGVAPEWIERLETVGSPPDPRIGIMPPPLSRPYLTGQAHLIQDLDGAQRLVQACLESPVSWIGIDTEFRYESEHPMYVQKATSTHRKEVWDVRTIHPFCLAFAVASEDALFRFVVDLRVPETLPAVQDVLDLPVPFVAHFARAELFVLWTLGLREPEILWDTLVAERALHLGRFQVRTNSGDDESDPDVIRSRESARHWREHRLSLEQVLLRYGLSHAFGGSKQLLQGSFLSKPFGVALTPTEVDYCAADAQAVAELYPRQRLGCDRAGITQTLDRVVQPWTVTAAEIEWHGVLYDREQCERFLRNSAGIRVQIEIELQSHGISNPGSTKQIAQFLKTHGLDHHFPRTKTGQPSTQDKDLKQRQHLHPAIPQIRSWRKVRLLASDPAVSGRLTAADGRVHPTLRVLGADTGRTQSQLPNIMGLGRDFRPLVRAPEGYGIGEVDLAQIEVGIAAAVFRDPRLIEDFNAGDVYVAMAKRIFHAELTPDDLVLDNPTFKSRHARYRNLTKPLVLGIIYGETIHGIARDLRTSLPEAKRLWGVFRDLYPILCNGMEEAREQAVRRGYAHIVGLRRFRSADGAASDHELRALGNATVQGAAGLVFFEAGNRLRRLLRAHGARIILPVHDAYVFEAPLDRLAGAAELVRTLLVQTVQERFPDLRPRADVNISHPQCWNDEGRSDSLTRFLEDPLGSS